MNPRPESWEQACSATVANRSACGKIKAAHVTAENLSAPRASIRRTFRGRKTLLSAEQAARQNIDNLLQKAGWHVCDASAANLHASRGVAIREFPLAAGYGFADYLLYVDAKAA